MTRSISVDERRARLARRHHLAADSPAADVTALAGALVGLHATDPASVYLSAWARVPGFAVTDLERCLYDDLTLVRHLCMRRTLFVLPNDLVAITQTAATDAVADRMRAKLTKELEAEGITDDGSAWLDALGDAVVAAVIERGPSTGTELAVAVPLLRTKLSGGSPTAAAVTPRVITLVAAQGRLARGRPQGSWTSSTHRWRTVPPASPGLARDDAIAELARRWLRSFGPAPLGDLVWWSGLGVTELKRALHSVETVEVDVDGQAALLLADDLERERAVDPWVALLPSLDPTAMGWKARDWYVGPHTSRVFDRSGNIGPTVWCNGRVVGGWAVRPRTKQQPSTAVFELFDDIGRDATAAVERRADELEGWLAGTVVTPRFPTPIDRSLRA